jgi:histone H2B
MPAKAAEKKPSTGGKAPAGKAPATEKKEAGKKTAAAPSGEKKKRGKTRKETYSSYIYKGTTLILDLRVKSFKISVASY